MLINSIKALNFKPINFQSKKSPLLKTNYCDTFERSATCAAGNPISFGHKYEGFPNLVGDRKKQLEDFIKNKSLKGDMEGACACLALKLTVNQTKQYKTIRDKYPELDKMQAALCAKAKLNDEQTAKYVSIVSSPIKYVDGNNKEQEWEIPVDEAILCVKENFDESKLKRYAQLRNRVVDLRRKSVRGMGKTHNYRPQYVLNIIKENKSDEQLKQEIWFYEGMAQYGLDSRTALLRALLEEKQREIFDDQAEENLENFMAAADYATLNPEQKKAYDKAIEINFVYFSSLEQAILNPEKYKKLYDKLKNWNYGFVLAHLQYAIEYAKYLNKEEKKAFIKKVVEKFKHDFAMVYALNPEKRKLFDKAIKLGIDINAIYYVELDRQERNDYVVALDNGLEHNEAITYATQLKPYERNLFNHAIKHGVDCHQALEYATLYLGQKLKYKKARQRGLEHNEAISSVLPPAQKKAYDEAVAKCWERTEIILYMNMKSKRRKCFREAKEKGYTLNEILDYTKIGTEEEREIYNAIRDKGYGHFFAMSYVFLNSEQRKNCLNLIEKENIHPFEAITLVQAGISSYTPEMLKQLPDNIWYSMSIGATKEVQDTMQAAIKLCLNPPKDTEKDEHGVDEHKVKPVDVQGLKLSSALSKNGVLKYDVTTDGNKVTSVEVELKKTEINNQPVLIIKDKNSADTFVAYKGAIAHVAPLVEIDKEKVRQEMKPHSKVLPEKQIPILTQAIQEFVFDITDGDNGCVISKGLEGIIPTGNGITQDDLKPYKGSDKTSEETQEHFIKLITALDKQKTEDQKSKFTAKNLLRMFPEDSILSINPYIINTLDANILHSISCEWKDKEGVCWEMRIHSMDLSDAYGAKTADKWVFRLGYKIEQQGENNIKNFLKKDSNSASYDFDGKFKGPDSKDSHIEFPSPVTSQLLNNIDFQKDIRKISMALYGENELNTLCRDNNILSENDIMKMYYYKKAKAVVDYAMKNPVFYYENQEYIDELRAMLKLPDLKNVA